MADGATRPAAVSYERVQDTQDNAKRRLEVHERVAQARRMPTPDWVKGPRPSDECIAVHDDDLDPNKDRDQHPRKFDIQGLYDHCQPAQGINYLSQVHAEFKAEKVQARGVDCYWANWPGISSSTAKEGMVLYLHGGGFVGGHPFVDWCAQFSRITGKPVLTVDFRRPPEDPFPAATLDAVSAYQWLLEEQLVPPGKIAVYGQSSGGTLTLLMLQELLRQCLPLPACGCPVSPFSTHLALATMPNIIAVMVGNEDGNGRSTGKNADPLDEKFNFFAGKFEGMPPLFVMVGAEEIIHSDLESSLRVVDVAKKAGVRVELYIVPGMQHVPDEWLPAVPESVEACVRAAIFIDGCFRACR